MARISAYLRLIFGCFPGTFPAVFLLSLLVSSDACSQFLPRYPDVRVFRLDYSNTGGEEGLTTFHYRRDGVLDSGVWMLRDQSRHSINYHIYDSTELEVEKYREFSDGLTSTEIYEYDSDNHRLRENFSRSDGVTGSAKYIWDGEGRLERAECENFKGWFSGIIYYGHEGDRLVRATIVQGNQTIGAIDYSYDQAGHLTSEVWGFGGKWGQTFTYGYEPIPARVFGAPSPLVLMNTRFQVIAEDYDYNKEGGGPSFYFRNDEGKLEKKEFQRNDGLKTETSYIYDDRGNLVTSHRVYHDGRTADFHYTYDDALRLIGKSFRQSDGQEGWEAYTYDRLGRLQKANYQNMDFWLTGTITFSYDNWGRLRAGQFLGEEGFDAELEFGTDSHGNVLTVAWLFSNGLTQTYQFKYLPRKTPTPEY